MVNDHHRREDVGSNSQALALTSIDASSKSEVQELIAIQTLMEYSIKIIYFWIPLMIPSRGISGIGSI